MRNQYMNLLGRWVQKHKEKTHLKHDVWQESVLDYLSVMLPINTNWYENHHTQNKGA